MPLIPVTIIVVSLIPATSIVPVAIVLTAVWHDITAAQSDCQQTQNQYQFFHDASLNEVVVVGWAKPKARPSSNAGMMGALRFAHHTGWR